MTKAQKLQEQSDLCIQKAVEFWQKKDLYMCQFWKNASIGIKEKLEAMTIKQLEVTE